jgi:transposase
MPTQLLLRFSDVPVTCEVQDRYHSIAPVLAGQASPTQQARLLNLSYKTICRWLQEFRENGMPGLFPSSQFPREPYTPERVIVNILYFKCCAPKASDRELARAVGAATGCRLHNETVKALLARYFFWRYSEFSDPIRYPVPPDPIARRMEMVRLREQGWTEKTIATLLGCTPRTVFKWLRRARQEHERALHEHFQDLSRAPHHPSRKVFFGAIHAVLELQKKYGYAGWFRIKGYLERDYGIQLGEGTVKRIMRLNRQIHLAPPRPVKIIERESREGPPHSKHPFEHCYVDIRYLDAKPGGIQLYSTLVLEGYSRTILAGSLTRRQDVGVVLRVYYIALLQFGCWSVIVSDHGGQFESHAFRRVNRRLQIHHHEYDKGHPWQSLIESQFGIQARVGEYAWERCKSVDEAVDVHRDLMHDHNRLPHFAHRKRNDNKRTPLEVLGPAHGREVDAASLHRAFSRMAWQRKTDERGFVQVGRWKIYVEEGLPRTPVQVLYWDGRLRAEYEAQVLTEYRCRWDNSNHRPKAISHPQHHDHPYQSRQQTLFDPLWLRDPVEEEFAASRPLRRAAAGGRQLRLYLGPELVK